MGEKLSETREKIDESKETTGEAGRSEGEGGECKKGKNAGWRKWEQVTTRAQDHIDGLEMHIRQLEAS